MESAFVPSILDFTSKRVGLTKTSFLCPLCNPRFRQLAGTGPLFFIP